MGLDVSARLPEHPQLQAALQSLQLRAWSCAVTIRLAHIENDAEAAWNTASGVLLESGDRAVIATAWHVLEAYRRLKSEGKTVILICDNMPILEPRTVYRNERADIAFIEVPERGRLGLGAVPYRPGELWPPPAVNKDDSVLLCGFPKILRKDGDEILHGDLNFLVDVASASTGHFMLQIEIERLVQAGRIHLPAGKADYGGASGGPVFLYDGGCNPLVGVISEAGEDLPLWRIASLAPVPKGLFSQASAAV